MKKLIAVGALCTAAFVSVIGTVASAQSPTIQIDSGPLTGAQMDGLIAFRGIPYAAPPLGELRWRPPQAPKAWKEPLDATNFRERCPQNADLGVFATRGGQEDCLYLNVFVSQAALKLNYKLPVLFWIHGGGLVVGAGSDYDASKLALQGKAVVVTTNYRLGVLGFLSHPGLNREEHELADYGLMDQRFALDWVQRNIAAFGGDPQNVTIFGESSGGNSVFAHILSPGSAGKFQHAIAMSGGGMAMRWPHAGSPWPFDAAEKRGAGFARTVGCDPTDAACLRRLPITTISSNRHRTW